MVKSRTTGNKKGIGIMKRTLSIIAALMLTFTMANFVPQGTISAYAETNTTVNTGNTEGSVTLDEQTGVLTLSGNITKEQVFAYRDNEKVKSIVAAEGCVFPEDSSALLAAHDAWSDYRTNDKLYFKNVNSIDISKADTSKVKTMTFMFYGYNDYSVYGGPVLDLKTINVSGIDTSKVETMTGMFWDCSGVENLDISGFNTSNVTSMERMFSGCKSLKSLDFSNFDTSKLMLVGGMFAGCSSLTELDLSNFDTSGLTYLDAAENIDYMFENCASLKTIYVSDKFVISDEIRSKRGQDMFEGCESLVGGNGTKWDKNHVDDEYARIDIEGQPGYFTKKENNELLNDVNDDKVIDIEDAVAIIGHINGNKALSDDQMIRADVDGSGKVDIEDAVSLINYITGVKALH